jgi:hypothetical protein
MRRAASPGAAAVAPSRGPAYAGLGRGEATGR